MDFKEKAKRQTKALLKDVKQTAERAGAEFLEAEFLEDVFCPTCGTNMSARERERKRRKKYMRERRKNDRV